MSALAQLLEERYQKLRRVGVFFEDGKLELYVAADDQGELARYDYDNGRFKKTVLGKLDKGILTWNITNGLF